MPKINQEEYEVLKELDDKWNWIARDEDRCLYAITEKPVRKDGQISYWGTETEDPYASIELFDEKHLFQFIQWSNSEPYNIAELIEEYETNEFYGYIGWKYAESEETEMKKDIEWLKNEINELPLSFLGFSMLKQRAEFAVNKDDVLELINQLDEPEVLSQELPVIPKFVADYIDDRKEVGFPIYQAIRIVREDSRFEHSHLREWLWTNKGQETFVRAWVGGYEVAEEREQKYYVDLESAAYVAKWDGNDQVDIYTDGISGSDEYEFHLTEKEIKDYDERFWPFAVKIEELNE